ncbi:hypothetical protein NU219Hw_g3127t1 [Hortaea werneckii]
MSIRHTCQGSPQQSSTSNCVACVLSGVCTGQFTAIYGQACGPQSGVEARRYVQPQGHAIHPDVAWMNQTLSSAPRNPFGWYEGPPNNRYGIQGGIAPPGPEYPYPTSINLSSLRVAAPPAGGEPGQPTQNSSAVGQHYPPNLGQTQQRQTPTSQQGRQHEEAVASSPKSGRRRSKDPHRSTHK